MPKTRSQKPIRVGVVGIGRGQSFMQQSPGAGMQLVALCRAVEKSGRIYMLAENYPFTAFNIEMCRLCRAGEIGRVLHAEGEYNHPMSADQHLLSGSGSCAGPPLA